MADDPATSDDIREAAEQSAADGVQSFSDGTNSVTAMDPLKQLEVAEKMDRRESAANSNFGLRFTSLNGGSAWG